MKDFRNFSHERKVNLRNLFIVTASKIMHQINYIETDCGVKKYDVVFHFEYLSSFTLLCNKLRLYDIRVLLWPWLIHI